MLPIAVAPFSSGWMAKSQREGAMLEVFLPTDNALCGPYSGIDFATKNQFGLNLLICHKVGQNSFLLLKTIIATNYLEITRKQITRGTYKFDD